uniref:TonB-dependent receptor domain-containing protein n=1 Tax=uncultured Caulobacter sp. TaxID=158749 RepID=UPI0025FDC60A|nr:TonB-dependent receptor [uncultured Caulobacter sp.]
MFPARVTVTIIAPLLAAAPASALAQQVRFNLAEQPAVTGIPEFARQARIQIVSPAGLSGLKTRAVRGAFTVEEGLRRLLGGTDLYIAARNGNAISLAARPRVAMRAKNPPPVRRPIETSPKPESDTVSDIVVTGMVSPERRLDAGLAITIASLERIHELAPNNTADLLKLAPGIWAETTGGATGANVFVRGFPTTGDAPFLTVQLDSAPIFPPTELAFSENTTLFRVDDMIQRIEILRGGASTILSNGQSGAVINFIQRRGTPELRGGLRLTTTDYGARRADGWLSGPLDASTVFAVGGFYRISDGIRNTQFPADRGGQITANLTRRFDRGSLTAYVRYTRDRNAFYTGAPLIADGDGGFSAIPGFDPLRDTLIGSDTRRLSIETGPGAYRPVDLGEGRGLDLLVTGASLEWSPSDDVEVTDRLNITHGDANTIGLFTGPVPTMLGQYVADTVARANADPRVVLAAGRASSGQAVLAATGASVPTDRYVLTAGLWSVKKTIASVTNELRVSRAVGDGHRLTAGLYVSDYKSDDARQFGNNLLLLAEPNARRIDLTLDNGVRASRDGFVSATTSQITGYSRAANVALFLSDRWIISERTSINAGARIEHQSLRGAVRNAQANTDFDGDPRTLYDNNGALLLGSSTALEDESGQISWTAGVVHKALPDRLTLHARFNHGSNLQSFEKLRIGGRRGPPATVLEAGADLAAGPVRASVNVFVNRFSGLQFTRLLAQPDGTVGSIILLGGARAAGLELDADITPAQRWTVELRGTWQDGRYRGFGDNSGNRVVRQPNLQFAISPVYATRVAHADVKLRATYTFVGERFSDVENLQKLPRYSTTDAGVHVQLDNGLYADLVAQNLFNAFGLTEGNTRVLGAVLASGPIIARPLFGRNLSLSLGYRF